MAKVYTIEEVCDILSKIGTSYTTTENGAVTPTSSGSKLIDQFGKVANFRGRSYSDVFADMEAIWAESPELSLRFIFYLRMISRSTILPNGKSTEKVQKGQGCKDEAFKRLIWLLNTHEDIFYKNIYMLPIVGSWKDIWTLMVMAFKENAHLDRDILYALMATAMSSPSQVDLIKKYMPRIKTRSNIKTERTRLLTSFARGFAKFLGMTPRQYNKFKSDGKAHEFQRLMCAKKFTELNWNQIPGIALGKLIAKKFIERHNLSESYLDWLSKQDTVKFNGYPYDLLKRVTSNCKYGIWSLLSNQFNPSPVDLDQIPFALRKTTDLQFDHLIANATKDGKITENVLCALDTSGSMSSGSNSSIAPIEVCISLGLYFSSLNQGHFHKKVAMFDSTSRMLQLEGSFCDMLRQIPMHAMGSTNFLSLIELLIAYRKKHPEVPIEEYPTSILVVSDMQFNPVNNKRENGKWVQFETNYEAATRMLSEVFPEDYVDKIKFIWWNVNGKHDGMPATLGDGGNYFFSGFDGSIVSLLLGREVKEKEERPNPTMEEILAKALSQEALAYVQI